MVHLNTIDPPLYKVLIDLSQLPELANFSLVGGTSLSLQLGHRKSDDLDFFTDRSFDILELKNAILQYNPVAIAREKKDYVDIAVLLDKFSFAQMLEFYKEKFPMNDKRMVLTQVLDTDGLENSVEPVMLIELSPEQAFKKIEQFVKQFSSEQIKAKNALDEERLKKIADMVNKKNKGDQI